MKASSKLLLVLAVVLSIGSFILGYNLKKSQAPDKKDCSGFYKHLSLEASCGVKYVILKKGSAQFEARLKAYISKQIADHKASKVGVYFRDLRSGPVFGINDSDVFTPASLMKTPLMLAFLSLADEDKSILERQISYKGEMMKLPSQAMQGSNQQLIPGQLYKVEDLLIRMIAESDNQSYAVLFSFLEQNWPGKLQDTYNDLGILKLKSPIDETISVRLYASIFRQLYTGSLLSARMSEKALEILAKSSFKKGIVGGLPSGIEVAHKYGERNVLETGERQLHDCGIIYFPDNPYLLCVMTYGQSYIDLSNIIITTSKMVYNEVSARRKD